MTVPSWNDIALVWDPVSGMADLSVVNGDLAMDTTLATATIISLFCDRLAEAGDALPDDTGDHRGWPGDTPLPGQPATAPADMIGSRLWLLASALQTRETLRRAESYARESLAWMVRDGLATSIEAQASYPAQPPNALFLVVTIHLPDRTTLRLPLTLGG